MPFATVKQDGPLLFLSRYCDRSNGPAQTHSLHMVNRSETRLFVHSNRIDCLLLQTIYYTKSSKMQERPYHDDNTASRLLSEVKHRRARLVLRWGTTLESRVLFFYFCQLLQSIASLQYDIDAT